MNAISPTTLLDALRWRYATKKFDPTRTIAPDVWAAIEQAVVLSPSSFGLQPWRFVVVTDPTAKERLVAASYNQTQPRDCSHHVVLAVHKNLPESHVDRYIARTAELRGTTPELLAPFKRSMMGSLGRARDAGTLDTWQTHQIYIALGQLMTCAAVLGIDTCPMEGIDPARYDEICGLAGTGFSTVVACAIGYRAPDDKNARLAKVRFDLADVVTRVGS